MTAEPVLGGPVAVVDYHTAGEPFRIVLSGSPPLDGATVLERRDAAAVTADSIRRLLVNEPRGHADMYGCFVTPPDDEAGDIGAVFFHKDGYSTACGHGTIALVTWAVESGYVSGEGPRRRVVVDVPSGRLETLAEMGKEGRVDAVSFVNVPSFVSGYQLPVQLRDGVIGLDIAYGGAFYASVNAADLGMRVEPKNLARFIAAGRELQAIFEGNPVVDHPTDDRLSGLYGTIFFEALGRDRRGLRQRNVTIFADGEVDRSPCGSGTSARLAILDSVAELGRGEVLVHESVIGTAFTGEVIGDAAVEGVHAVVTKVRGSAYRTGEAVFTLDPDDPIGLGFQLR
ncbi:MAG: proline racemase family protein [Acidimicrobiia bacterium]|nr:proline racemase family protein [Acidimicrobiia bacterium]